MASESGSDSEVKLVCLPQSTSDVAERQFVLKLIGLYRDNPILWDVTNQHYTNKYRRMIALNNICDILKTYKPNYTVEKLKKKLNILRTNFNKERNKVRISCTSPDGNPEAILWYYNDMTFLLGKQDLPKIATKNTEPTHHRIHQNLKRKRISIISASSPGMSKCENEEEMLAKCWAIKLRKLSPDQKLFAEKIINDTLFEAELGNLTRHGATFNGAPVVWTEYSTESHSPIYKSPSS